MPRIFRSTDRQNTSSISCTTLYGDRFISLRRLSDVRTARAHRLCSSSLPRALGHERDTDSAPGESMRHCVLLSVPSESQSGVALIPTPAPPVFSLTRLPLMLPGITARFSWVLLACWFAGIKSWSDLRRGIKKKKKKKNPEIVSFVE